MSSLWVVFRMDQTTGITSTVAEVHAVSQQAAVDEVVARHGSRDWWDYWCVPSEWFKTECLDMLLDEAYH